MHTGLLSRGVQVNIFLTFLYWYGIAVVATGGDEWWRRGEDDLRGTSSHFGWCHGTLALMEQLLVLVALRLDLRSVRADGWPEYSPWSCSRRLLLDYVVKAIITQYD